MLWDKSDLKKNKKEPPNLCKTLPGKEFSINKPESHAWPGPTRRCEVWHHRPQKHNRLPMPPVDIPSLSKDGGKHVAFAFMNFRGNKDLYSKQSLFQKEKSLILFMESGPISEDISNMSSRRGSSEGVEERCWRHRLGQASQVDDVDGDLNTKAQNTCDIWKSLGIDVWLHDNVKASWISWRGLWRHRHARYIPLSGHIQTH